MAIPPVLVKTARCGWNWQWLQLMGGLGPADHEGNYRRPAGDHPTATLPAQPLEGRGRDHRARLILGRSCPWAHRTWLVHTLRQLGESLDLLMAKADHQGGRWQLDPPWRNCSTLLELYRHCGSPPSHRATVPVLVDPLEQRILGNESSQLVELLNRWPAAADAPDLAPADLGTAIAEWQELLQGNVNDGVYRCGFARNQTAYNQAESALFAALEEVERSLGSRGPWLCGDRLTLADLRLFPTLIRWESVYAPLFGCSRKQLWQLPNIWRWRQQLLALPGVMATCDAEAWRQDYFGALFPLNPGGIVPAGPELSTLVNSGAPGS
ncbi:MAG: Glutathionyl-hydroquinone reductase YqjG [Synechococcus sp. CC9902]|nr:MAG: Glutathionyl-hydroquinone reductase YqjG [Synechococcus sp. CC9902]